MNLKWTEVVDICVFGFSTDTMLEQDYEKNVVISLDYLNSVV